jgi:AcrR family transcriptional regulator
MTETRDEAPRKKRQQRKSREQRRCEILRIAADMFAERGYHATGVNDLIDAAGVGKSAFYHHVGSKEALLYDIAAEHVRGMVAFGEEILEDEDLSSEEKFRAVSRRLMRTIAENLPELTVFFHEISTLKRGERARELIDLRDRFEAVWVKIVNEGVTDGTFKRVDPISIKFILGMHNYSYIWVNPKGRLTPEQMSDVICELILEGLRNDS